MCAFISAPGSSTTRRLQPQRFLQHAPVVRERSCKAGGPQTRPLAPAPPPPPRTPRPPAPSPPPPAPFLRAPVRSLFHSAVHRIFQLSGGFPGAFWRIFWSQTWGHRAAPLLVPLLTFIPWFPKLGPPSDPKNGATNFGFFGGGTAHFAQACGLFVRAAYSATPGHLGVGCGRDRVLAGPSQWSFHVA